jgi:hypothetical protein
MHFVGVKDVTLTRPAVSSFGAIEEGLDTRQGDADRVGVVAVWREGLADEVRFEPLDPVGALADSDPTPRPASPGDRAFAQAFKTIGAAPV